MNNYVALWCIFIWINDVLGESVGFPEKRLLRELFQEYNSMTRPVQNYSDVVTVNFGISLNQILDLDEKKQIITTSVWVKEIWHDESLTWEPEKYENTTRLIVSSTELWLPDVFIFNTAGGHAEGFVNVTGSKLLIENSGMVTWTVPLMIKSSCPVDVTYFPYDQQTCEIHFGSWIYDVTKVDLQLLSKKPNLQQYILNNEFDLLGVNLYRTMVDETCCPGTGSHPIIHFQMTIKRKSIYYDYIVIAPTIMLCILTLASFWLPCHHGEKIAIGLTVFLTLYVLQLLIAENVPDTNTTPVLGVFLFLVMTLNCISLIMATLVMSIKRRSTLKPVPKVPPIMLWVCKQILGKITCTPPESRFHRYNLCDDDEEPVETIDSTASWASLDYLLHEFEEDMDEEDALSIHLSPNIDNKDMSHNGVVASALSYRRTLKNRQSYRRAIQSENTPNKTLSTSQNNVNNRSTPKPISKVSSDCSVRKQQWCYVAETVDKASFIVYFASMFVTILTVLVFVPSLQSVNT
ncbi:neuronal acetylcholine receptor subunit beta-3-like [Saccostrea echinata]|uniref:neuronal acetylcholine receptor subunit beta-3-like n=1 Tax=Saccostrea echinata TaxID=191078 RepID=UPI002A7F9506|nr:neuronal acetylcholine receptor subunit beta-3-like [Saccostrea echinata]